MEIKRLLSYSFSESITDPINQDIRLINCNEMEFSIAEISQLNQQIIEIIQLDYRLHQVNNQVQYKDRFYQQILDSIEAESIEKTISLLLLNLKSRLRQMKKRLDRC